MGRGAARIRAIRVILIIGSLLAIVGIQSRIETGLDLLPRPGEFLYLPEGKALRRFCLGHEGLVADVYWTWAVQYFGRKRIDQSPRFDLLGPLLRITTDLDPHLIIAYRFGAIFLTEKPPRGAGKPEEALQLLRKGIVANPEYWRFWQDLGFIYYWDLKDYPTAARVFQTGSQMPGAALWLKVMAAAVSKEGGAFQTSRLLWQQVYDEAESASIRRNAQDHLAAFKAQDDLDHLNQLLDSYRAREGHPASTWQELVAAGEIGGIPRDPSGVGYRIGADGRASLGSGSNVDLKLLK